MSGMTKDELDNYNRRIIDEFRTNGGQVGGDYDGMPLLLLHHTGAKTGIQRINPMTYLPLDGGGYAVFASNAAQPNNPHWYHNLRAHPKVKVEIGTETHDVVARLAEGAERKTIWTRQKAANPLFADFEQATSRRIPVIVLEHIA
jgi:deazaflavin-dependent oxidoreductase (nitroreductase family)